MRTAILMKSSLRADLPGTADHYGKPRPHEKPERACVEEAQHPRSLAYPSPLWFPLLPETLFFAADIIDRFSSLHIGRLTEAQLVGISCTFKAEEIVVPSASNALYGTDSYTEQSPKRRGMSSEFLIGTSVIRA
jgi:hypothetical protein